MEKFNIRPAKIAFDDAGFIISAFDSTLAHLEAIGSREMWGSTPFSQKDGFAEETIKDVQTSEAYHSTGQGDALRIFIAEVRVETPEWQSGFETQLRYRVADEKGYSHLSVGAAFIREEWIPGHLKSQFEVQGIREELEGKEGFVFLDVVVTDYRTSHRKGAGKALVQQAVDYGRSKRKKVLYLDAWSGNGRKLVGYYEHQGFKVVADFKILKSEGRTWPGALLRMDL
ncbi:hypothetical protein Cob_v006809 [Colletotrichum orbiculare MAFF 240422]|uniref:N-acetyltransferase domain-containing protein n=1 Tax=Colletotrichum orbiculare (strain 104-T / ATCC 96160 / CBS 514.97 / LARS 414 / MAFF 240422) TaxID=1213857 RepID=A0A484FSC4_COLOR|nr:hypothetical protein Cob_v006809 [Colletotrichum orbiculare MAFF 240422]